MRKFFPENSLCFTSFFGKSATYSQKIWKRQADIFASLTLWFREPKNRLRGDREYSCVERVSVGEQCVLLCLYLCTWFTCALVAHVDENCIKMPVKTGGCWYFQTNWKQLGHLDGGEVREQKEAERMSTGAFLLRGGKGWQTQNSLLVWWVMSGWCYSK